MHGRSDAILAHPQLKSEFIAPRVGADTSCQFDGLADPKFTYLERRTSPRTAADKRLLGSQFQPSPDVDDPGLDRFNAQTPVVIDRESVQSIATMMRLSSRIEPVAARNAYALVTDENLYLVLPTGILRIKNPPRN